MYIVVRFFIMGNAEQHSIQRFDTEVQAKKRWHNIIAADIDNPAVTYELVQVVRDDGLCTYSEVLDNRPVEPEEV